MPSFDETLREHLLTFDENIESLELNWAQNSPRVNLYHFPDISRFRNLRYLSIRHTKIKNVPILDNPLLIELDVSDNEITRIDGFSDSLRKVTCGCNYLSSLPDTNNVEYINCYDNRFEQFPKVGNNLKTLYINNNNIRVLSNFYNLEHLACTHNKIHKVTFLSKKLKTLNISYNLITSFTQLQNIHSINISHNNIRVLPNSEHLLYLKCNDTQITYLPYYPKLKHLFCYNINNLICLPIYPNLLEIHYSNTPIHSYILSLGVNDTDVMTILRLRNTYYYKKYGYRFRDYLWDKVRRPKAEEKYHPNNLLKLLESCGEEDDLDEILSKW